MKHPTKIGTYGIVTAISSEWFTEFKMLYQSIQKIADIHISVIGLDLLDEQKQYIEKIQSVKLIEIKEDKLNEFKKLGEHWRPYYKPYYMLQSPYDYTLWIDADAIVLEELDEIFAKINDGIFFTADYFAPQTCLNDPRLYEEYSAPVPSEHENIAINTGVLGYRFPRDKHIFEKWLKNVDIVNKNPHLKNYIKLYDQGVFIWTMREMGSIGKINVDLKYNCPAKRNLYEYDEDENDYKWPSPNTPRMGGDIFDNIKLDNPGAVIVHFAGKPKLSDLIEINNHHSIVNRQRLINKPVNRVFCVGMERCGTHTLAEIIRRSSEKDKWRNTSTGLHRKPMAWIRHEHNPSLAKEAWLKFNKHHSKFDNFNCKLAKYKREDCNFLFEADHRLSFFIDDIYKELNGDAKFVVLLRNPIDLIRSRLMNFTMWPNFNFKYPGFYQMDMSKLRHTFGDGPSFQNEYRIKPDNYVELDIIDMHLWEITTTINVIMDNLKPIDEKNFKIWYVEDLDPALIVNFVGKEYMSHALCKEALKIHYGSSNINTQSESTVDWINDLVVENKIKIYDTFNECLNLHGLPIKKNKII